MTANEWLEVMKQASDFPKGMEKLILKYGEMLIAEHDGKVKKLNIPDVSNRTFSVDEVKILLEKQKQACVNEFIHAEMTMEQAKRRVLNAPTVSF